MKSIKLNTEFTVAGSTCKYMIKKYNAVRKFQLLRDGKPIITAGSRQGIEDLFYNMFAKTWTVYYITADGRQPIGGVTKDADGNKVQNDATQRKYIDAFQEEIKKIS